MWYAVALTGAEHLQFEHGLPCRVRRPRDECGPRHHWALHSLIRGRAPWGEDTQRPGWRQTTDYRPPPTVPWDAASPQQGPQQHLHHLPQCAGCLPLGSRRAWPGSGPYLCHAPRALVRRQVVAAPVCILLQIPAVEDDRGGVSAAGAGSRAPRGRCGLGTGVAPRSGMHRNPLCLCCTASFGTGMWKSLRVGVVDGVCEAQPPRPLLNGGGAGGRGAQRRSRPTRPPGVLLWGGCSPAEGIGAVAGGIHMWRPLMTRPLLSAEGVGGWGEAPKMVCVPQIGLPFSASFACLPAHPPHPLRAPHCVRVGVTTTLTSLPLRGCGFRVGFPPGMH